MAKVCRYCNAEVEGAYARSGCCKLCASKVAREKKSGIITMVARFGNRKNNGRAKPKPDYAMGKYLNIKLV